MARLCGICTHPQRAKLDRLIVGEAATNERIATLAGVSESAVRRHRANHFPTAALLSHQFAESRRAVDLVEEAEYLRQVALGVLRESLRGQKPDLALRALREAARCLELRGRLTGELTGSPLVAIAAQHATITRPRQPQDPERYAEAVKGLPALAAIVALDP